MSFKNLLFFTAFQLGLAFSVFINGWQTTDLITYSISCFGIGLYISSYRQGIQRKYQAERTIDSVKITIEVKKSIRQRQKEFRTKNHLKDCAYYAHNEYLICALHPDQKNCKNCTDYETTLCSS